jgi:hypothetical protein
LAARACFAAATGSTFALLPFASGTLQISMPEKEPHAINAKERCP